MADTFAPKPGTVYSNLSGPNKGITGIGSGLTANNVMHLQNSFKAPTYIAPGSQSGQVLGASTYSGGGGNRASNPAPAPQNPQQTGGGGGTPDLPTINDLYAPQMNFLNGLGTSLENTKSAQLADLNTQKTGKQKTIGDQQAGLKNQLQSNHTTFDQQLQSAYAQAAKDYDALSQRNIALYGGQSSAGQASNELLNNTYLNTRQGLQNTGLQGNQLFDQQGLDITSWGDEQNNNLDTWFSQASDQINSIFQQGMNQINSDKAATEENKTQAKLALLQQVVNHRQALQDYDSQLRGQVQAAMAMQGFQGNGYNTQPFMNNIQNLSSGMGQNTSALSQLAHTAGLPQQQAQNFNYQYSMPNQGKSYDDFYNQQMGS
jgi:hypothetical protein